MTFEFITRKIIWTGLGRQIQNFYDFDTLDRCYYTTVNRVIITLRVHLSYVRLSYFLSFLDA